MLSRRRSRRCSNGSSSGPASGSIGCGEPGRSWRWPRARLLLQRHGRWVYRAGLLLPIWSVASIAKGWRLWILVQDEDASRPTMLLLGRRLWQLLSMLPNAARMGPPPGP